MKLLNVVLVEGLDWKLMDLMMNGPGHQEIQ
jgi:hypothetical protein